MRQPPTLPRLQLALLHIISLEHHITSSQYLLRKQNSQHLRNGRKPQYHSYDVVSSQHPTFKEISQIVLPLQSASRPTLLCRSTHRATERFEIHSNLQKRATPKRRHSHQHTQPHDETFIHCCLGSRPPPRRVCCRRQEAVPGVV